MDEKVSDEAETLPIKKIIVHPETLSGEIFLTNICKNSEGMIFVRDGVGWDDIRWSGVGWDGIGWKTKRRGNVAYGKDGTAIADCVPVFVQISELPSNVFNSLSLWEQSHKYNNGKVAYLLPSSDLRLHNATLQEVKDDFAQRWEAGTSPTVQEYIERYPKYAQEMTEYILNYVTMSNMEKREAAKLEASVHRGISRALEMIAKGKRP